MIVEVYDSPNALRVASRSGTLIDLHCSATGKAICSTMAWDEVVRLIGEGPYPARTGGTITTAAAFREDLEVTRERGYAIDDEEYNEGVRCAGAPIYQGASTATAAIGITGAAHRLPRRAMAAVAQRVLLAAGQLSFTAGSSGFSGAAPGRAPIPG